MQLFHPPTGKINPFNYMPIAMSDNTIVIDLSNSNHNRPVSKGSELIQKQAFDSLKKKLEEDIKLTSGATHTDDYDDYDDEIYPAGSGLTYFIDGTRGAGKSTFLRFALQQLANPERVHPLMYLDPSRIESSEIVLLHVLKQLRRLAHASLGRNKVHEERMEKFRRLFQQIAGGLHLFIAKDDVLKDLDAELFLDYGLDRAADSQRLRTSLHQIIDLVCEMYKVSALVVAIDDADTKAEMAIKVLECIRKYLDTPRMVVLVTGDLEMYSLLVQNHFQRDFASEDKGLNADRRQQQTRMVEHLEDQYLLKLFPIQRRIQLKTLHTLAEKHSYKISVPGTGEHLSLKDAIDTIAEKGLRLRVPLDKRIFREHVLKLPVRSVLQLLSTYFKPEQGSGTNERERASEALRATALSSLYRHDVDVESIAEGDLHATIEAAFDLSLLDGDPDTSAYLRPQVSDLSLRNVYVSLSADVARLCEQNPAKAITYMLGTAGSSSVYRLVEKSQSSTEELQKKLKHYLSVGRTENSLNWSWHATAAFIGATTSANWVLRQGVVGVRTGTRRGVKTVDTQLDKILTLDDVKTYPAIAFSQSGVKQYGNTQRYLSIFNTLGLIANLLELDYQDRDTCRKQIEKQLNKVLSIPTVSLPNWRDLVAVESSDEELDGTGGENAPQGEQATDAPVTESLNDGDAPQEEQAVDAIVLELLISQIDDWLGICNDLKGFFHPSAVLLGKIWNRLYFSLDNISSYARSSKLDNKNNRCAKTMELFAWALINACLVEEFDYHYREPDGAFGSIDRKNPVTSGDPVISKFNSVSPTVAPLSYMIATCPLILGLIEQSKRAKSTAFVNQLREKLDEARKATKKNGASFASKLTGESLADYLANLMCGDSVWLQIGEITLAKGDTGSRRTLRKSKEQNDATESYVVAGKSEW